MVEAINKVAQLMGIQTIAEFVENDDQLELLRKIGVDYAQGFGISRPQLFFMFNEEFRDHSRRTRSKSLSKAWARSQLTCASWGMPC